MLQATHDGRDRSGGIAGVNGDDLVEATFRQAHVGMAITDRSGRVLAVNQALCSFLGHPAPTLTSMSFSDLTVAHDASDATNDFTDLDAGSSEFEMETRCVTARGEHVWARVTGVAVRNQRGGLRRVIIRFDDLSERDSLAAALNRKESYDDLTDLANRRLFYERLSLALVNPRRPARRLAVLVVNLNKFQQLNAGLGHVAADLILVEVARRIMEVTGGKGTVARLGGDWFAVLAPGVTMPDDAVVLGIALLHRLGEAYWADGNAVFVSARVGVSTAPNNGTDAVTLVRRATDACNDAKVRSSGWAVPPAGGGNASQDELGLVGDLRAAIVDGDLTVAYQPIVDREGRVHTFEALARWFHSTRGPVPPDQFIVLAEQHGMISALTTHVLTSAVQQAARWGSEGAIVPVAVNLSGMLVADPGLVDEITRTIAAAGLPPTALTLEITETAIAAGDNKAIWAELETLRERGVRISIDDFGTGYSSLTYLKDLPVDELKIDRSFVAALRSDGRAERIVHSIIDLAHSLDLSTVAEGVEDEALAEQLLRLGVDFLQGYVIARPCNAQATTRWLADNTMPPAPGGVLTGVSRALDVLLVDDQVAVRAALRTRLKERHHRVVEAHSGSSALQKLRTRMPDVIILDHLLPGTSGIETVPALRDAGYSGPILLISGSPTDDFATTRFPLDVWPVSKADEATLIRLIDGYAAALPSRRRGALAEVLA
ncbi:MAG: diguanylate cyclase [Acidimicrobiaceae bacterium]|jgi:diguanylate cyclase (GGDEF)-like protein/PAS domain S-box-containing protein|nr:diguanylate cyclase [Acidimicrobiaceae bacterium]